MRENITTHETGPAQGSRISIPLLKKWDGEEFDLVQVSKPLALLFVSVYCSHCVDMLPDVSYLHSKLGLQIVLFTNGNNQDIEEMVDYFKWQFPCISLDEELMESLFNVVVFPFLILLDSTGAVEKKAVVYNKADMLFLVNHS